MTPKRLVRVVAVVTALCAAGPSWSAPPRAGQTVFVSNCARCHGVLGDGDSAIARVVSPKPPDLRATALSLEQMRRIVSQGGEGVGRSPIMPRWGGEISDAEIEAVVVYVMGLRESYAAKSASRAP